MTTRSFLAPNAELTPLIVRDVFGLVGVDIDPAHVLQWTPTELLLAYDYAVREHLSASDNRTVRRRPRPFFTVLAERKREPLPSSNAEPDTCVWDRAYAGPCGAPGHRFCAMHAGHRCVGCGGQADRDCAYTGQFVCGYPICSDCVHTTEGRHERVPQGGARP